MVSPKIPPSLPRIPARATGVPQVRLENTNKMKIYNVNVRARMVAGSPQVDGRRFSSLFQVSGVRTSLFKFVSSFGRPDVTFQVRFKFRASGRRFSSSFQVLSVARRRFKCPFQVLGVTTSFFKFCRSFGSRDATFLVLQKFRPSRRRFSRKTSLLERKR